MKKKAGIPVPFFHSSNERSSRNPNFSDISLNCISGQTDLPGNRIFSRFWKEFHDCNGGV